MVEIKIRPAGQKDNRSIRSLILEVQINPTGLDWHHFMVATSIENEILGCGQIKQHADGSHELASIAVKARVRHQGVASAIINELLDREKTRPLYLMCRSQLEVFYNKFGFQKIDYDAMPGYYRKIIRIERVFNAHSAEEHRLIIMQLD